MAGHVATRWLLCDTPLWDWDLTWNSERPRFSSCFRHLILSIAPCCVLWLTVALDAIFRRGRGKNDFDDKSGRSPWTLLTISKHASTCLLILCTIAEASYKMYSHGNGIDIRVEYGSITMRLITFILALFLQIRQRREGRLSSYKLALFWTLFAFCQFLSSPLFDILTDNVTENTEAALFVLGTVSLSLVLIEAILSHFTDPPYDSVFYDSKADEFLIDHQAPLPRLLFSWLNRLMRYGYKHILSVEDLDALRPDFRTSYVCRGFLDSWSKEESKCQKKKKSCGPSLMLALLRVMWPTLLVAAFLEICFDFASLAPPIVLDWMITYIDDDEPGWHGYVYAFLLFATTIFASLLMVHDQNNLIKSSVVPRSGLCAAIMRKIFRLNLTSRRNYSLGELCNLVAVDGQRIVELIWSINSVWSSPLRIALTIALLWQYLGVACLAGVAVMVVLIPLTAFAAVHTHRIQRTQMEWKDARLRLMNDILNGIKILKLFAWEFPFTTRVSDVREKETKAIKRLALINAGVVFIWILAPFLVALSSFVLFVLLDEHNVLDPSIVFVSLTLFSKLRVAMSGIPEVITEVVQSNVSIKRVISFLLCEELDKSDQDFPLSPGNVVELSHASFSWGDADSFLQDVTVSIRKGDLVAVVGRVGSGKSALLAALLGEMTRTGGCFRIDKEQRVAFVPQTAWIQNATLRQNVLFVNAMDKRKYDSVIRKCCLRPDLKMLPGGDHTEIGEKGVNLSGGQKQRVSLARAVYHNADFYLLDDPLSAVDSHVAQSLFNDVIGPKGVLGQKTRILVTHDLSVLPSCDSVILMSEGRVVESGEYEQLMKDDGELARLVNEFRVSQKDEEEQDVISISSLDPNSLSPEELKQQMRKIVPQFSRTLSRSVSIEHDGQDHPKAVRFIENEKMEIGRVRTGVYCSYFRSAGFAMISFAFFGFAAHQALEIGSNVWLSQWSSDLPLPDGSQDVALRNLRMAVYGIFGAAQGACVLMGAVVLALASTRASILLHRSMMWSIMRSPLTFFETTPLGRILNRFGKDIDSVDVAIPAGLNAVVTVIASAAGALSVICFNHPLFLLIMVPISIVYIFVQVIYVSTSRQMRRMQSVTFSPVLSFFSESIQGARIVRAFGVQPFFVQRQDALRDDNCRVFYHNTLVNRWLGVRLQLMGSSIILIVSLLTVFQRGDYSAALVGLTLSYALNITDILARMVRILTQLETRMVSVERIDEYSQLEEEASWTTDHCNLSLSEWPSEGSVVFRDYKMRYRPDLEPVLRGINIEIPGGQKVGVVGRTGAGKSSLAQALFRVVEPAEGTLIIDGVDVSILGLHDLRSKITVIPQDPVLFGGELRFNLDPTGQHSDQEVLEALKLARINLSEISLDMSLEEGGDNLSVGQRQQVCLARALLKRTRILVLDEATAAVDLETDRLIQETIRSEFRSCTVITVAHRLYTILDYDRILVMDKGRIVEDGPPEILLKKANSLFAQLARAAGLL